MNTSIKNKASYILLQKLAIKMMHYSRHIKRHIYTSYFQSRSKIENCSLLFIVNSFNHHKIFILPMFICHNFFDTSLEWFMGSNKKSDEILFSEFEMFKIRSIAFILHSTIFNTPKINVTNGTISRFCDMQHL